MKKLLVLFLAAICLTACSKEDEPDKQPEISADVRAIWSALSGAYETTFYVLNTETVWYTETITFRPYKEPKLIMPPYSDQKGEVFAFGEADIKDSRFMQISGVQHCYYSIYPRLDKPTISFYKFADNNGESWGHEDCRSVEIIDASKFEMWPYGTSKTENVHIYTR